MSNKDWLSHMDTFSPSHQPDEGYSEDPLDSTIQKDIRLSLASLRSPAELPAWISANAAHLPISLKKELTMALLSELPTSTISEIVQKLNPRLYIDFIQYLPAEICLKILSYLDPNSLVSVIQTCRAWCDIGLDSKLWERIYHLEGWKVIRSEIDTWETKINVGLNDSISHLHRIQNSEGHTSKIRAILNDDEDTFMSTSDSDRAGGSDGVISQSIFGSPTSSFSSNRPNAGFMGDAELDLAGMRGKSIDRSFGSYPGSRDRAKELNMTPEVSLPPILPPKDPRALRRSTLWMWDVNHSRYRINWKYLYNMRRRLESNWELCKAVPFQLPHPNHPTEGHQECIYSLQFDSNYLVSGSRDRTMRIWNLQTRRLIRAPLVGHRGSVLCLQFDASPEEDLLVSGSSDSNIIIWRFSTGEILQRLTRAHRESVLNVRFDSRILVTSSKDKSIKIFNRKPLKYGETGYRVDEVVSPVATNIKRYGFDPDLGHDLPVIPPFTMIGSLEGHSAAVNAIQVRGDVVVSVSGDRHIKIWNWPQRVCTQTISAHDKGIACVEFDGRRVVSGSSDHEVCIFDAPTGVKVAQLRGHSQLVRTVQAGFGDYPYSKIEDELEARRVDAEYFKAVEAGLVEHNSAQTRRRERRTNAGSSRPTDIVAYGAKLPPGGGGGRKYGRIISGSYDCSIIIWRRDKEGVWKPAHHLRQEEAAAAAQQRESVVPESTLAGIESILLHPSIRPLSQSPVPPLGSQQHSSTGGPANLPHPRAYGSLGHISPAVYTALIDQAVPAGPAVLHQVLATLPGILTHHNYLQVTIEKEPSPFVRAQLVQVVVDAQLSQQRASVASLTQENGTELYQQTGASSTAAVAGPSEPSASSSAPPTPSIPQFDALTPQPEHATAAGAGLPTQMLNIGQAQQIALPHTTPALPPHPTAGPPQDALPAENEAQPPAGVHHPHIVAPENGAARVFKLQFDARKIVCCSQAPVIVGWDFCNGDPELEEASRFFATID
ncbi:unnamed protein product [Clonostachys rosea]|uniref:F-box domain-containing protein n=1 Tax=Bionectria ochroleuca TaxID=29856 RepID=A0ABY6U936_BIOOC|nr:unnamed protein product [Clonostachys rosea]